MLSILIPVYNESETLALLVERVLAAPLPGGMDRELVIVDDASTDGTDAVLRDLQRQHPGTIRAFFHKSNRGKGAAVRLAIAKMQGAYAIFQDADLEYDPHEYGRVLAPILENNADVVYGSRFASSPRRRVLNFHHELGNRFLTFISNLTTGLNLTDMETCYKAFRSNVLKTIPLRSDRFGIEPEITAKVAKRQFIVYEVPVSYYGRTYLEGKKINWKDGVSAIYTILKYTVVDDCYRDEYEPQSLENLLSAQNFSRRVVQLIRPHLGRRILELGAGIGNVSRFLPQRDRLTVADTDPVCLDCLANIFRNADRVDVASIHPAHGEDFAALREHYDSVVCLNILEHLDDDGAALRHIYESLAPGGVLALMVPQNPGLFGSFDERLGHRRRYEKAALNRLLRRTGFTIRSQEDFNAPSILGWRLNGRWLRRSRAGKFQIRFYDLALAVTQPLQKALRLPGLSILTIAEKGETGIGTEGM